MLSQKVLKNLSNASFIRAMFEEGERLRKIHGADKVFDFSLGNPDYEPPVSVQNSLKKHIVDGTPGIHKYMNNAGYADVRQKIANSINSQTGLSLNQSHIIMTVGAAGGLNVVLKSILNPGDEVIVFSPYFVEYIFYIDNHGGVPVIVPTNKESFTPDFEALKRSITPNTKAVIINSPNNPTGVVYSETLKQLSDVLNAKQDEYNSEILVISDEPYTKIVYDNVKVPSVLNIIKNSVAVNSYSKSLALPGERIGYIAASPHIKDVNLFLDAMIFANRTLGYVNAPSIFQKVIADTCDEAVCTDEYKRRRDFLYDSLTDLGYSCVKPQGAFYLFPKSIIEDDVAFAKHAIKYNLLIVPGTGFGCPGYFRIAYCMNFETIKNSIDAFKALRDDFK